MLTLHARAGRMQSPRYAQGRFSHALVGGWLITDSCARCVMRTNAPHRTTDGDKVGNLP